MNIAIKQLPRIVLLTFVVAVLALALLAQSSPLKGKWLISPTDNPSQVQFTFSYSRTSQGHNSNSTNSNDMPISDLVGLTPEGLKADGAHTQFKVVRASGTFACEGWIRKGEGSGHFDFEPNRNFAGELQKRGIAGQPSDEQLMRLAFANMTLAFIDDMKGMGYTFDLDQLIRVSNHGVTQQYMHELQALGIKPPTVERLIRLHDHGVNPAYIKEMMALGYKGLGEEQLVRLHDHGVDPAYVKEMISLGYKGLTQEDLVRLHDHGVNPDYIREIHAAGLDGIAAEELTRMKDHGVSPEFAKQVKSSYRDVTPEQLIHLQDHGVTSSYLQANINGRTVEEVIRMHDRGGNMD